MTITASIVFKLVSNELPKVDLLISKDVFFMIGDQIYRGHYHENGCFYSSDQKHAGHTKKAIFQYGVDRVPPDKIDYWCYTDDVIFHEHGES
jgi:hypothetical protein